MSKQKGQQPEPPLQSVCQMQAVKWWGVYSEFSGDWSYGTNGLLAYYPAKEIADVHALRLGGRWKAKEFAT